METSHRQRYLGDALSYAVDTGDAESVRELISFGASIKHQCPDRGHVLAFDAVARHHTEIVKLLLEAGTDVESQGGTTGNEYETLLCLACSRGFLDIVLLLLEFNADINGGEDTSPLHMASLTNRVEIAKTLIEKGARIEFMDCYRRTPLYCAFVSNSVECARLLVAHGANIMFEYQRSAYLGSNREKLMTVASDANNKDLIDLLLENGYVVTVWGESEGDSEMDTETDFTTDEEDDHSAIARAHYCRQQARQGDTSKLRYRDVDAHNLYMYFDGKWEATKHFMQKNIHFCHVPRLHQIFLRANMSEISTLFEDPEIKASDMKRLDRTRKTVLHYAFASGKPEAVEKCIVLAAVHGIRSFGFKPLFFAAKHGYIDMLESLVKLGMPLESGDSSTGQSPLLIACCNRHSDVVKMLVSLGANVNAVDFDGQNALHIAAENGNIEMVKFLLDKGAQVMHKNDYSWTILHHAANANCVEIMEMLLNVGPGLVNMTGQYQRETPLHVACFLGRYEAAEVLLKHGADIDARDYKGNTPLHLACTAHNTDLVCLLIQQGAAIGVISDDGWTPLVCVLDKYCEYPDEYDFNALKIMMTLLNHGVTIYHNPEHLTCNPVNQRVCLNKLYKKNLFAFVTFMQLSRGVLSDVEVDVTEMIRRRDLDSVRLIRDCGHTIFLTLGSLMDPDTEEVALECRRIKRSPTLLLYRCVTEIRKMLRPQRGSITELIKLLPLAPGLQGVLTFPNAQHVCHMAPVAKLISQICCGSFDSMKQYVPKK